MLEIIQGLHYVIPPSAIDAPTSHKLYKKAIKTVASGPESISWPTFLILSTLYKKVPAKYIEEIRRVHGRTSTDDLTSEYLAIDGMEPAELSHNQIPSKTNGEDPKRQESPNSAATKQHRRTAAQVQEKGSAIRNNAAIARKAAEDQAASGPAPPRDIYDFLSDNDSQESMQVDRTTSTGPPTTTTPPLSSNTTKPAPKRATKRSALRKKEPLILPPDISLSSAQKRPASPTATNRTPKRVRFLDDDAAFQTTIEARYSAMEDFFRNLSSGATQVPVACGNSTIIEKQTKEMLEINKKLVSTTQTVARVTTTLTEFMSNLERSLKTHCDKDTSSKNKSKST
ncbi:uncharacterized protein Triagg1_8917 [Trichoderma aggressivum f. europaeum]|uniref:Uncharacterized protein n=1 Tax=Trichoderma aggressivum f. europaeum TaxID=173218 RepID=A0AAE1I7K8_9HYPO|nr:hypothetical protein Triagg1_8917 [Trichoderma aggressivum f. europaeum]